MRKMKMLMLLMGLILFSSELLAKNSTTDLNVTSKVDENNRKEDPFAISVNFDDAEKAEAELEKSEAKLEALNNIALGH